MSDWPFGDLTPMCADLLLVDPPWLYSLRSPKGEAKSAQAQYACMPLADIVRLPVLQLARGNCWLFMWATAPMLPDALAVMRAWGFRYVSRAAWRKTTVNGKSRMGPGYVVRTLHEDLLIGAVGEPYCKKPLPSLFDGVAREHSRKPDELFPLLERFAPHAFKVELFGRESRPGWRVWGNQSTKFDEQEAA